MKKRLVPVVVLVLASALVWVLVTGLKTEALAAPGEKAPDFALQDTDGNTVTLSEFQGQKVVLNFFATWCEPCIDEAPELEAFGREFEGAELLIIAKGETKRRIAGYIEKSGSELPYLLDTREKVSSDYNVIGQPETIIIDEDGIIQERFTGPTTKEKLIEMIQGLK
ncbi:TlpA family protein disulfide reductase [Bacillus marinisedimentorum]|uniref:TlpA family protein disulfide reductase n=1 Tax=Bacillus marinisedimentorum TaxID=1821260 RepID=UPI0008724E19|nr:TlpA disulfide reductase family protein [Bacillus marinisedimentorum]